jgi:hypothetical protein
MNWKTCSCRLRGLVPLWVLLSATGISSSWATGVNQRKEENSRAVQSAEESRQGQLWKVKVIEVKYADVAQLKIMLQPFGSVVVNPELKALTISGYADAVVAMEEVVRRFDIPTPSLKNIELKMDILASAETGEASSYLPGMESAVKELKKNFPYPGYHQLDSVMMYCRNGRGSMLAGRIYLDGQKTEENSISYEYGIRSVTLAANGDPTFFQLDGISMEMSYSGTNTEGKPPNRQLLLQLRTDVGIQGDQKVILGKAMMGRSKSIFLVLSAKRMD